MKLIPVIVHYSGDKVEEYINLDHVCSISPFMDYDEFDVLYKKDSIVEITFINGKSLYISSSYDDFIERLIELSELTWGGI